mgnify:CR=1 FL=1
MATLTFDAAKVTELFEGKVVGTSAVARVAFPGMTGDTAEKRLRRILRSNFYPTVAVTPTGRRVPQAYSWDTSDPKYVADLAKILNFAQSSGGGISKPLPHLADEPTAKAPKVGKV